MSLRLKLVFRLLLSWGLPLLVLVLLGGSGGVWWAKLLGMASLPFLALALSVGAALPMLILKRPMVWAGFAVAISLTVAFVVAGRVGVAFGAMMAVPAAILFVLSLKKLPLLEPAAT
jgi:hypothetical protein